MAKITTDDVVRPTLQVGDNTSQPIALRLQVHGDTATGQATILVDGISLLEGNVTLAQFEQAVAAARLQVKQQLDAFKLEEVN